MSGKSSATFLEAIDWPSLDIEVSRQQRNREVHSPAISLFRWWARRPHALIGKILDAAPSDYRISDPFSGGGTVALEAARRGLAIYAQDLHPWATTGLATALDRVDPDQLQAGGAAWLTSLEEERRLLYGTRCPKHDTDGEIITTFWVRTTSCPECRSKAFLYPYSMISLASRRKDETHAFFGCNACGTVTRSARETVDRRCSGCRRRLADEGVSQLAGGLITCRATGCGREFPAFGAEYRWQPALVQRLCGGKAHIDVPSDAERDAAVLDMPDLPVPLRAEIPHGLETKRLRRAGISHWSDLYPARQMRSMLTASAALDRLSLEPAVRARLQLVLCGAAEMAGYSSRWDRFYPKAFEATANHRFSLTGFAAEVNLLASRGRGTLARRLIHSVRAARWGEELHSVRPRALGSQTRKLLDPTDLDRPTVVRGSSTRQLLPDHSIDLVLTDPPYYDDVQYAELGALFLTWAQSIDLIGDSVHVDFRAEVVPNASRGTGTTHYFELLSAVLTETRRTLKPTGRAVLTFHNTEGKAWWALARALGDAGFYVTALAVAHAENETDHAKRGRRSFSRDLVIECRSARSPAVEVVATTEAGDDQSRQLLAAGRAVAELSAELADGAISETRPYEHFGHRYRHHLGDDPSTYIRLGKAP